MSEQSPFPGFKPAVPAQPQPAAQATDPAAPPNGKPARKRKAKAAVAPRKQPRKPRTPRDPNRPRKARGVRAVKMEIGQMADVFVGTKEADKAMLLGAINALNSLPKSGRKRIVSALYRIFGN